jgi:XapX domain-containing protein
MIGYAVSLLMGVATGVAYGLVQVRSPAPPLIALIGLLGMVLGEHAIVATRHYFAPTSTEQASSDGQTPLGSASNPMREQKRSQVEVRALHGEVRFPE